MAGPAAFSIGQAVRVWYKSLKQWKVAQIRAVRIHWASGTYTYGVECAGRINTHWYRAEELQPLRRGRSGTRK